MFYEAKLKVEKENKKGERKQVAEHFIIEGIDLFCEAEAKALELYNGNCDVFAIIRSKIREIVNEKEEDKPFFKATLIDIFVNEDGTEKETPYPVLVCASDMKEANRLMEEYMKSGMQDFRLEGIVKTKILDAL